MAKAKKAAAPAAEKTLEPVATPPSVLPMPGTREAKALARLDSGGGPNANLVRKLFRDELARDGGARAQRLVQRAFEIAENIDDRIALRGIETILRYTTAMPAPEKPADPNADRQQPSEKKIHMHLTAADARKILTDPTDPLAQLVSRKTIDLSATERQVDEEQEP